MDFTNNEKFWINDISVLYKKYYDIVPQFSQSREKQMNIITRLCFYILILLIVFNYIKLIYIPISIILLVLIFYIIHRSDKKGREDDINKELKIRKKLSEQQKKNVIFEDGNNFMDSDNLTVFDDNESKESFQVSSLGFDGYSQFSDNNRQEEELLNFYTPNELDDFERNTCRKPTHENPFMNPNISDYANDKEVPKACNVDDEEINDNMELEFKENMFRNIDDVFDNENSIRQFYSVPSRSFPNNQKEFALWLYDTGPTCKENSTKCFGYEDLRYKRNKI